MRISRTAKAAALSALAAGSAAAAVVPAASAAPAPASERYAGRAGAQVAEVSLLGRRSTFGSAVTDSSLDMLGRSLTATATGTGTDLSPASRSVARFQDTTAAGGTNCAEAPLGAAVAGARSKLPTTDAGLLPDVAVAAACGGASVTGGPEMFTAESTGGRTEFRVKLPVALQGLVSNATGQLAPETLATPVGDLVAGTASAGTTAAQAVDTLNGVLGTIAPGVALPAMEPQQTVGTLLNRIQTGDLLHVSLATATARNGADAKGYVADALADGGVIEILPGFRGAGSPPLLRMTITRSHASVPVDRASMATAPVVENAVVRVESDLLGNIPVAGPPVVNGLVHGLPVAGVPGGNLPVAGGVLGGGLPFDQIVSGLGLRSGAGFFEVGPGQSASVLCAGPVAALCSEVTVGAAKAPVTLPNGMTHAESSTVTVHFFKGLDSVVPGSNLATALAQPAITKALGASAPAGLALGDATDIPGIRLVSGGAVAEAGGDRVLAAEVTQTAAPGAAPTPADPTAAPVPVRNLPHTGGQPFSPAAAPVLLASAAALGRLVRRRRHA